MNINPLTTQPSGSHAGAPQAFLLVTWKRDNFGNTL